MTKKILFLSSLALLGVLLMDSSSCLADSAQYVPLFLLVLAGSSALAHFCATVMVMFGLSYLAAFLAAFVILFASFLAGDYFGRNIMDKLPRPIESQAPATSTDASLRSMNLS